MSSPRKARKVMAATPTRSSARLKGRKVGDGAGTRDTSSVQNSTPKMLDGSIGVEVGKDAFQEERLRREWQEELSGVEERIATARASLVEEDTAETGVVKRSTFNVGEQVATASGASLEKEDTPKSRAVTPSTLGAEEQDAAASGASLEEEDPAERGVVTRLTVGEGGALGAEDGEREMFDPACSCQRSNPGILTLDSARRQFEFPENPAPPSSTSFGVHITRWNAGLKVLSLAVQRHYDVTLESARRRLRPLTRFLRGTDIEDMMFCVVRTLAFLALLSTTIHVGWKICGTNLDYAAKSVCKAPSLHEVCRFSCEHALTKTLFPTACSGNRSANGDDSHTLLDDQAINKYSREPRLLEKLTVHQQHCSQSRNAKLSMIDDELPILAYVEIATASEDVCDLLKPLVSELITYYTGVHSSTAHMRNDIHFLRKSVREGAIRASKEPGAVSNEVTQGYVARNVSSWKVKFHYSSEAGSRMQDGIDPLRQSLGLLLMGLREGLAIMLQARNETILQFSWHRKAALWMQLSWLEPKKTRAMSKAILVLKQWVFESSALDDILNQVYSDVVVIIRMVRDVYAHRLGHSAHALRTDAELSEMVQFLGRMSEDVARIRAAAGSSRVMGRLLQGSGIKVHEQSRAQAEAEAAEMAKGPESLG